MKELKFIDILYLKEILLYLRSKNFSLNDQNIVTNYLIDILTNILEFQYDVSFFELEKISRKKIEEKFIKNFFIKNIKEISKANSSIKIKTDERKYLQIVKDVMIFYLTVTDIELRYDLIDVIHNIFEFMSNIKWKKKDYINSYVKPFNKKWKNIKIFNQF